MPQFAALVLKDTSVTPNVDKTYLPTSNGKQAMFTDRSPEKVLGWPKLSSSVAAATVQRGSSTAESSMTFPILPPQVDGCCVAEDVTYIAFNTKATVSNQATAAQRASALALFRAWVASPQFAATAFGESFYA